MLGDVPVLRAPHGSRRRGVPGSCRERRARASPGAARGAARGGGGAGPGAGGARGAGAGRTDGRPQTAARAGRERARGRLSGRGEERGCGARSKVTDGLGSLPFPFPPPRAAVPCPAGSPRSGFGSAVGNPPARVSSRPDARGSGSLGVRVCSSLVQPGGGGGRGQTGQR